jgi:hypothetical protein
MLARNLSLAGMEEGWKRGSVAEAAPVQVVHVELVEVMRELPVRAVAEHREVTVEMPMPGVSVGGGVVVVMAV